MEVTHHSANQCLRDARGTSTVLSNTQPISLLLDMTGAFSIIPHVQWNMLWELHAELSGTLKSRPPKSYGLLILQSMWRIDLPSPRTSSLSKCLWLLTQCHEIFFFSIFHVGDYSTIIHGLTISVLEILREEPTDLSWRVGPHECDRPCVFSKVFWQCVIITVRDRVVLCSCNHIWQRWEITSHHVAGLGWVVTWIIR